MYPIKGETQLEMKAASVKNTSDKNILFQS